MERTGESGRAGGRAGGREREVARASQGGEQGRQRLPRKSETPASGQGPSAYACPRTSLAEKLKSKPKRRGAKEKGAG